MPAFFVAHHAERRQIAPNSFQLLSLRDLDASWSRPDFGSKPKAGPMPPLRDCSVKMLATNRGAVSFDSVGFQPDVSDAPAQFQAAERRQMGPQ
ncbi:hypothetical protein SAMN06265222_105300 [Neorhodopirellula lusitana]|uniref:Uncharacterized protein n=1 Tax=Neorhodopirellula lusitana TaxID=445327 RepID=A0ABY1Q3V0_9BACT|nr:hypothetical protein [Neorhodopirellula lusitana]SMP57359.1 hypothetical protein SAMN06265222_105300 [Neorhodopirellula lusitana]